MMMVTASAVSSMVLLLVWGIAHSQVGTTTAFTFNPGAVTLLVAGTIGMVALPVLVFVATIARLSARVRDRRLSNLRLLGLTAAQT
ncbi:MAG: permease, partial [Jiangellaceae bacterium]